MKTSEPIKLLNHSSQFNGITMHFLEHILAYTFIITLFYYAHDLTSPYRSCWPIHCTSRLEAPAKERHFICASTNHAVFILKGLGRSGILWITLIRSHDFNKYLGGERKVITYKYVKNVTNLYVLRKTTL